VTRTSASSGKMLAVSVWGCRSAGVVARDPLLRARQYQKQSVKSYGTSGRGLVEMGPLTDPVGGSLVSSIDHRRRWTP
jgi:hypothetical protein